MKTETTTTTRKKVIVISFDADEQQAFFDIVSIKDDNVDGSAANRSVATFRPYVNVVDILDAPALCKMLTALNNAKSEEHLPFAMTANALTREQCIEVLNPDDKDASISLYEDEILRELVRSGLENDTISESLIPS